MSLSALVQPHTFMAGYSAIPLRISDTEWNDLENFKYITNILWDIVSVSASTSYDYNSTIYTKLTTTTSHNFKKGDTVLVNDINNGNAYTGYYIILAIINSTNIVIDRIYDVTMGVNPLKVSRVIKYLMSPDPDGEAKLNLSNTIKDFLTENLTDTNQTFSGPDTVFNYDLYLGRESKFVSTYSNIINDGGYASFVLPYSATTDVPFQIGDYIYIEQDQYGWNYTDNAFNFGRLAFTGTTQVPFDIGSQILVTGQITNPQYNGYTTVYSANTNLLITNKSFASASPIEPGVIYGIPEPSYGGTATITDISVGVSGVTITIDKTYQTTYANPLTGTMRYADDKITEQPNLLYISGLTAYNARVSRLDYSLTSFDKYVIQNRAGTLNNISTILGTGTTIGYRIEKETKSWLLNHVSGTSVVTKWGYIWYDANNTLLGSSYLRPPSSSVTPPYELSFYGPVGIDQVYNATGRTDTVPMSGFVNSIHHYFVLPTSEGGTVRANPIRFDVNDDCSMYDMYHLMWKDKYGSWLSYPFIYLSRNSTEIERKTYYKREGNWDNNTFGYNSYDRGQKQYYNRSRDKYLLNTGWLNDWEVPLIKDLMESASVYIQLPDGTLIGCIIEETEMESKKGVNDQVINYTLNVRLSNNEFRF